MSVTLAQDVVARAALRVRYRKAQAQLPFAQWLPVVTPEYQWDVRHLQPIIGAFQRMVDGDLDKLMVFLPPRHAKSETLTVRGSAYVIEQQPSTNVIVAAYNHTLAQRFSRKTRRIVRERVGISDERGATDEWETLASGTYRAVGIGGGITGMGGNWIFIDDPIKSRMEADSQTFRNRVWEWYTDDLLTRREPGAKMVLIMTRWHMDDLAGRILEADGPAWEVIHLPAIALEDDMLGREPGEALWPERYPPEFFADIEAQQPRTFSALYQGMPQPDGGAIFIRDWWDNQNRFDPRVRIRPVARVMFWDTAEEDKDDAAFTVGVVGELDAGYNLRIIDVVRQRVAFPDLVALIERTAHKHNRDGLLRAVDIEYASSGRQAYQTIMAQSPQWLRQLMRRYNPKSSKEIRAQAAAAWCQNGMVLLPMPDDSVPWLYDFERELYDFPTGTYKDQVDAFSGLVNRRKTELTQGYRQRRQPATESEQAYVAD